jgi:hypothetical protein
MIVSLHNYCQMSKNYHQGSSSKYLCKIHLIFATKYRKKLLRGALEENMKQILIEISNQSDFTIDIMEPSPNFKQSYLLGLKSGNLKGIRHRSYPYSN